MMTRTDGSSSDDEQGASRDGPRGAGVEPVEQERDALAAGAAERRERAEDRVRAAHDTWQKAAGPDAVWQDRDKPDDEPGEQRKDALACSSPRPSRRTSAAAFRGQEPEGDDPLLSFAPVPHSRPRRNSITADKQREFIAALAATGIVTQAARTIGKSLEALYRLRQRPGAEEFRKAWDMALDRGVARLEDCALSRAIEGEERPIVSGGALLGWYTRHDNALVQFFLRQRRPERYGSAGKFEDLKPGHPVYDRLERQWEARRMERSPTQMAEIHASIMRKAAQWRMDLEAAWEKERQALIASGAGYVPPRIDSFGLLEDPDAESAEE